MCHDLERSNRLELDWLAGKVVALDRELGVATPLNETVYAILKLYRMGKPVSDSRRWKIRCRYRSSPSHETGIARQIEPPISEITV
jgi:Ketopantoate reductase PanE/ApbA C terminal